MGGCCSAMRNWRFGRHGAYLFCIYRDKRIGERRSLADIKDGQAIAGSNVTHSRNSALSGSIRSFRRKTGDLQIIHFAKLFGRREGFLYFRNRRKSVVSGLKPRPSA